MPVVRRLGIDQHGRTAATADGPEPGRSAAGGVRGPGRAARPQRVRPASGSRRCRGPADRRRRLRDGRSCRRADLTDSRVCYGDTWSGARCDGRSGRNRSPFLESDDARHRRPFAGYDREPERCANADEESSDWAEADFDPDRDRRAHSHPNAGPNADHNPVANPVANTDSDGYALGQADDRLQRRPQRRSDAVLQANVLDRHGLVRVK